MGRDKAVCKKSLCSRSSPRAQGPVRLLWNHTKIFLGESLSGKWRVCIEQINMLIFNLTPTCVVLKHAVLSPPLAPKCSFVFHMYPTERRASRRETPLPQSILAVRK